MSFIRISFNGINYRIEYGREKLPFEGLFGTLFGHGRTEWTRIDNIECFSGEVIANHRDLQSAKDEVSLIIAAAAREGWTINHAANIGF